VVEQAEAVGAARLITADGAVAAASETLPVQAPQTVREWGGPAPSTSAQPIDRPATIVYTSGSTGPPKAALHTWANHLYSAKGANANMPLRRGDRWLLSLPLYHVGGLAVLVRCALAGATVEVPPPDTSVEAALDNGATHVSMVATQYRRVLTAIDGPPPPAVRAVLLGGGPIPDALLRAGRAQNWPLHTTYGCTEMASQVTTTPPGASLDTLRSAGRRLPHRRLRVDDGQILVGGPPLFAGYVTPDGIDNPRIDGGWYPTGDRGHLDAQGRLHVAGRMDRMFVSGGENIQPEEIESVLERVDGVQRAVVVPVPDPEYGRRPVAFVRHSAEVSAEDLRATLRDTLPGFKIPEAFHSLTDADTENGLKVDHARLKKRARKLHE
jgi:O-succinylbenzoic acid--CoA ligase